MKIPPTELAYIKDAFAAASDEVLEAYEEASPASQEPPESPPEMLADAMERLLDTWQCFENDRENPCLEPFGDEADKRSLSEREVLELGNYGLGLLEKLAAVAARLGLREHSHQMECLAFALALWLARNGAEIGKLEPVVNGLAHLANGIRDRVQLEELWHLISEMVQAVSPSVSEDLERDDPQRPWRILLFNWAIVATRSHRPALMVPAFEALAQNLPEDAPNFFREGMGQMDALDYPSHVRTVMETYFETWSVRKTLH
jgi:hypothetical protein